MVYKDGEFIVSIEKILVNADCLGNEILQERVTIVSPTYPFEVMLYSFDSAREKALLCLEQAINRLMHKRIDASVIGVVQSTIIH